MIGSSTERLERKIKELNALKADLRHEMEEAERMAKKGEMDQGQLHRIKARNEVHIERINEKIRQTRDKLGHGRG